MEPSTVYGISKLAGERWVEYYNHKYNLDIRSIRYPGLISYKTEAGGGTTDYAVEIFYEAVRNGAYESFIKQGTEMPMMYMEDAIDATLKLMDSPKENLSISSAYNLAGISFTPEQLAAEIKKHLPDFKISYKPDFRQQIAESWPQSIDASVAKNDWGLNVKFDLAKMTEVMLSEITKKIKG
jgi:nucleoside-diphosphate-sugar epimerase